MFRIASPDLPTTRTSPRIGGASLFRVDGTAISGGLYSAFGSPPSSLLISEAVTIPSYTGGEVVLTIPDGVGAVSSVTLGGVVYTPESFSQDGSLLTVTLNAGHSPAVGTVAIVDGLADEYSGAVPTNEVLGAVPSLFSDWNADGSITINRGLEEHPTASLTFKCAPSLENTIRSTFLGGQTFTFFGIGFRVSKRPTIIRPKQGADAKLEVSVDFEGRWQAPLENKVKLVRAKSVSSNTPEQCARSKTSVADVFSVAGIPYSGASLTIPVPRDTDPNASTTPGSELESRARVANGFAFYSNPTTVDLRRWAGTALHVLSPADVVSEIEIQCAGQGAIFNEVQLSDEFKNIKLELNEDADDSDFEADVYQVIRSGSANPNRPPQVPTPKTFAKIDLAFDEGGPTKSQVIERRLNGQPLEIEETTYGFKYSLSDTHTVRETISGILATVTYDFIYQDIYDLAPDLLWAEIGKTVTTYDYDDDGYLRSVTKKGYSTMRLKRDENAASLMLALWLEYPGGETFETGLNIKILTFAGLPTDFDETYTSALPRVTELLNAITQFQIIPIFDVTNYYLKSFVDVYPDVTRPADVDDWVEPKFCYLEERLSNSSLTAPDPARSNEVPKPDVSLKKIFNELNETSIIYPDSNNQSRYQQSQDRYKVYKFPQSVDGELSLAIETFEENEGRPSIHTRLERSSSTCPIQPQPSPETTKRILLNTPNSGVSPATDPEYGSVSFPDVGRQSIALAAAQTEASISNTVNAETWTLTVIPRKRYWEGDRVWFDGKMFVVLSVTEERAIEVGRITSDGWQLTLGRYVNPPLSVSEVS